MSVCVSIASTLHVTLLQHIYQAVNAIMHTYNHSTLMEFKTQFSTKYFHIPTGVDAIPNVLGGCVLCNVYVCSIFCRRRQRCCCCLAVAILYAIYLDFFFFLLFFCGLLLSFDIRSHFCINPMSIHWSTDTTTEYDMVHINLFNSYENIIIVTVRFFCCCSTCTTVAASYALADFKFY